jgi:hypothetical protein
MRRVCHAASEHSAAGLTRPLRSEQVRLQVALTAALMHVKGFPAPETKAAAERARLLIEQAEAAEPDSVVIAESTRKLLGNLFELEDLGAQDLKGMSGPLRAWVALRPASVESRFEAMHASCID